MPGRYEFVEEWLRSQGLDPFFFDVNPDPVVLLFVLESIESLEREEEEVDGVHLDALSYKLPNISYSDLVMCVLYLETKGEVFTTISCEHVMSSRGKKGDTSDLFGTKRLN